MSTPKDGYYIARVQYDTGGTLQTYVYVREGVIRASDGDELKLDACSEFHPVSTQQFCGVWPREAAMELDALRTANAGLVEKVKRLEAAGDEMAAWLRNPRNLGDDPFMADQWEATKGQP